MFQTVEERDYYASNDSIVLNKERDFEQLAVGPHFQFRRNGWPSCFNHGTALFSLRFFYLLFSPLKSFMSSVG